MGSMVPGAVAGAVFNYVAATKQVLSRLCRVLGFLYYSTSGAYRVLQSVHCLPLLCEALPHLTLPSPYLTVTLPYLTLPYLTLPSPYLT